MVVAVIIAGRSCVSRLNGLDRPRPCSLAGRSPAPRMAVGVRVYIETRCKPHTARAILLPYGIQKPNRSHSMSHDYLERILKARVYDVAIESPLEAAPRLSRRLDNEILFKRE